MEFKTQEEYLLALAEAIKYLNPKDATKVLRYYETRITNSIEYGEKEEDVIRRLPDIETVAKETYESHGVNYLEMRKRLMKRKQIFNNIIGGILSFFILIGFFVIMYFLVKSIFNMFTLFTQTFKNSVGLDKFITPTCVILYILCILLLTIYVIDLFIILLSNFLGPLIKIKDETKKRKILSFTITGLIEEKSKNQKVQMKLLVSFIVFLVICIGVSYSTGGYLKRSLENTPLNKDTIELNEEIKTINIEGYNGNIYFKPSTTNTYTIEHQFEFKHDLNLEITSGILNLSLEMTKDYDVFNLLTEPTQNIIIYVPVNSSVFDLNINMDESIVDISEINNIRTSTITIESKGTVSLVNSSLVDLTVKGYDISFAVAKSKINGVLDIDTTKGQTLIQQESNLLYVKIKNGSSYVKFENSFIGAIELDNRSGTIELNNLSGNTLVLNTKTSVNTVKNCLFDNLTLNAKSSCQITLSNSLLNEAKISIDNSQLLLDFIKGNVNINSTSSSLYISSVGQNNDLANSKYNEHTALSQLYISSKGTQVKTEIADCNFKLSLEQDGGLVKLEKTFLIDSFINCTNCDTIDLLNLKGNICNLYFSKIEKTIIIDSDQKSDLLFVLKQIDTLSFARMMVNDEVIELLNEALGQNE